MKNIFTLIAFFIFHLGYAQQVKFAKTYGSVGDDVGRCVRETADHGFIVTGSTSSAANTNADLYLFKLDSMGHLKWSNHFGSSFGTENGKKVIQTADGGYIAVGFTNSLGGANGYDIYIVKANSNGGLVWEKTFGGSDWDFANDILLLPNGNYLIAGTTYSYGAGNSDMYLLEIDNTGEKVWDKTIGGTGEETANAVALSKDNKLLICGNTTSEGHGGSDGYVVKAELDGNTIWTKTFGSDSTDFFSDILSFSDTTYIAVGTTNGFGLSCKNSYYVRMKSDGTIMYEKNDGGVQDAEVYEVITNPSESVVSMIGYGKNFGQGGKTIWFYMMTKESYWISAPTYGGLRDDEGFSAAYTHDNGYVIGATTDGYTGDYTDVLIIKTDMYGRDSLPEEFAEHVNDSLVGIKQQAAINEKCFAFTDNQNLIIQSSAKPITRIFITTMLGEVIMESEVNSKQEFLVNTNAFASGLYFVKTTLFNNSTFLNKVVIN